MGITMSGQSTIRGETTAMASAGVPAIDSLPPELLETIFGFLAVGNLCTARLVCAQFRNAASRFLHSVEISAETLRYRPEITLTNFPNLSRVTIFNVKEDDLLMLARHPLAHTVTHVRADHHLRPVLQGSPTAAGPPLQPLPNLVSLTVWGVNTINGVETVFPFPETLRELKLKVYLTCEAASLVTRLTNLTCLQIKVRSFEAVAALTALRKLEICCRLSLIPFVAELTLLTHLQFQGDCWSASFPDLAPLASLTRLHRLVHLGFSVSSYHHRFSASVECQLLSSVGAFTALMSLDMGLSRRPDQAALESVRMTPFSQLTALMLRDVTYHSALDASFLPRFNLERLQVLSFSYLVELDRDGVAALRRATGLTRLELWTTIVCKSAGVDELGMLLPCLPRLRALSLGTPRYQSSACGTPDAICATFPLKAIPPLTELTFLELKGRGVTTNADLEVCCGLKNLRVLRMEVAADIPTLAASDSITRESFFAVAQLPELRMLEIAGNFGILGSRWNLRDNVWARLHTERHAKGWPPLEFNIHAYI